LLCTASLVLSTLLAPPGGAAPRAYAYLSPLPGSDMVSCWNNVAIRQGELLDPSSLEPDLLTVTGSASGPHGGRLKLAGDGRTILFTPDQPYALGETVRVRLAPGARTSRGAALPVLDYRFRVSTVDPRSMPRVESERLSDSPDARALWPQLVPTLTTADSCGTLFPGFPEVQTYNVVTPNPGVFFMAPWRVGEPKNSHLEIVDDLGQQLYERSLPTTTFALDFKMQPDGRLTYFRDDMFDVMDSAYAVVDHFTTGNGYSPDLHDIQFLPDGHTLMLAYDYQHVGMDTVVAGGDPNATVIGLIVQELDENHDVIFQWRSWDHFQITDARSSYVNLLASVIDYVHGNSVEKAPDGNIVISCRHMNEVTKIDRQTGDMLWRLGLHAANNQFTFPDDTRGFSHQHDARILPNGHLTLFDNGNDLVPEYSRALEFALDEVNRVATVVWEYRHTPDAYGSFTGNVQRHADGRTTIGWGGSMSNPASTDLHADGTVAAEISSLDQQNYRIFRHDWRTNRFLTDAQVLNITTPGVGQGGSQTLKVWNNWDRLITIDCLRTTDTQFGATLASGTLPVTLAPGETTMVQVVYGPTSVGPADSRLYVVQQNSDEMVAQTVTLHGRVDAEIAVEQPAGTDIADGGSRDFGEVAVDGDASLTFTIKNTGSIDLTGLGITIDGTDAGQFSVTASPTAPVSGPAGSTTFTVRLAPTSIGAKVAALHIASNDADENPFDINLGGTGTGVLAVNTTPAAFALSRVTPNPAPGEIRMQYALPVESAIRLSIVDLQGREVAVLAQGLQSAGWHSATWDDGGERDRPAAGVYFVRFQAAGRTLVQRFVLTR
jgi:hypothetical protein